jgi:hypothetical protein
MVEIGRVRVKTGNAPIEQKISAYPHKPTSHLRLCEYQSGHRSMQLACRTCQLQTLAAVALFDGPIYDRPNT